MKILTITLLFSAMSLFISAQTFDQKILDDINQRFDKDPIKFLKTEVPPDYVLVASGHVFDLKTVIGLYEVRTPISRVLSDVKIRQFGNTAVVTGRIKHSYTNKKDGSISAFDEMATYIASYQSGKWLIVSGVHSELPIDQMQEEAAIKTVLETETKAYHDGNTEGVRTNWNFTPQTRGAATTVTGQTLYASNGDQLRQYYTDLKPTHNGFSNANYNIKINGGSLTAYVTYEQTTTDAEGKTLYMSHEFRNMDKVNGVWKITSLSAHHFKP